VRPIRQVAVIGAGTMGGGIAMSLANIGIASTLIDADPAALDRGLGRVRANYASSVSRGRLEQSAMDERLDAIRGSVNIADVKDADLVIEAVFEDLALKQSIFRQLDAIAKPGAILATNTSGTRRRRHRRRDTTAAGRRRCAFLQPGPCDEAAGSGARGQDGADVIATLMDLGRRMGKVSVLSRIYPGFIGNALFRNYTREAHFLVEDGALPHEVDAALTRFGYAMGIFAVHDLAGNDVGHQTRKAQMATRPTDRRWNDLIMKLVDLGRLGQKSGSGWYRYDEGSRTPQRDPESEKFIVEESGAHGHHAPSDRRRRDHQALRLRDGQRRARSFSNKASRCARATSTSSTSPATAFRRTMADRCTTRTASGSPTCLPISSVSMRSTASGGNPHRCSSAWRATGVDSPICKRRGPMKCGAKAPE
jgi:3-hydroxyacyl-CoA dehydrogenase